MIMLLKSILICHGVIHNMNLLPLIQYPPTIIRLLISKIPKHVLISIFIANTNFLTPYWLGGPNSLSHVGSSIHLFQNLKFSMTSRISQHIRHADLHRQALIHKCKQPLLYGAICNNIHRLFFLPITFVSIPTDKHSCHALRRIEHNIIKAVNNPLNVIGRGIPARFSCKHSPKIKIKNSLQVKRRNSVKRKTQKKLL